jgi:hypothetical protein
VAHPPLGHVEAVVREGEDPDDQTERGREPVLRVQQEEPAPEEEQRQELDRRLDEDRPVPARRHHRPLLRQEVLLHVLPDASRELLRRRVGHDRLDDRADELGQ